MFRVFNVKLPSSLVVVVRKCDLYFINAVAILSWVAMPWPSIF